MTRLSAGGVEIQFRLGPLAQVRQEYQSLVKELTKELVIPVRAAPAGALPQLPAPGGGPAPSFPAAPLVRPAFAPPPNFDPARHAIVTADVRRLESAFQRNPFYVGPGGAGGVPGRYEGFGQFLHRREPVQAPYVALGGAAGDDPDFINGRHRFAYLRDRGLPTMPFMVAAEQAGEFRRRFGAGPAGPRPLPIAPPPAPIGRADPAMIAQQLGVLREAAAGGAFGRRVPETITRSIADLEGRLAAASPPGPPTELPGGRAPLAGLGTSQVRLTVTADTAAAEAAVARLRQQAARPVAVPVGAAGAGGLGPPGSQLALGGPPPLAPNVRRVPTGGGAVPPLPPQFIDLGAPGGAGGGFGGAAAGGFGGGGFGGGGGVGGIGGFGGGGGGPLGPGPGGGPGFHFGGAYQLGGGYEPALRPRAAPAGPRPPNPRQPWYQRSFLGMGQFFNLYFGGIEAAQSSEALRRSQTLAQLAPTNIESLGAEIAGISQVSGGFSGALGAAALNFAESRGLPVVGPAALERSYEIERARLETFQRTREARRELGLQQAERGVAFGPGRGFERAGLRLTAQFGQRRDELQDRLTGLRNQMQNLAPEGQVRAESAAYYSTIRAEAADRERQLRDLPSELAFQRRELDIERGRALSATSIARTRARAEASRARGLVGGREIAPLERAGLRATQAAELAALEADPDAGAGAIASLRSFQAAEADELAFRQGLERRARVGARRTESRVLGAQIAFRPLAARFAQIEGAAEQELLAARAQGLGPGERRQIRQLQGQQYVAEIFQASRQRDFAVADLESQQRALAFTLARNPLGASIEQIRGQTAAAQRGIDRSPLFDPVRGAIGFAGFLREQVERRSFADRERLQIGGLEAQRDAARQRAAGRPLTAAATEIGRSGLLAAEAFQQQGQGRQTRLALETSQFSLAAFRRELTQGGRGVEISDPFRTSFAPRDSSAADDLSRALRETNQLLAEIKAELADL